ncbi:hypothetical protein [Aurantiacibacter gangjinensis]|uniref:Uncharacterized protein n=1 Tax=Aurantiacibacter gangjinensis TaxID=502682 RepID=A0A0G9MR13_9SPHN|nr:hypothetical protein [Aurantiacibacter gangjinensis]APE29074.1 hypothetical protein BMF35_a2245 [Aurantiacibacter gangjinensis]KLE33166.1 hypothetical protein AAW01_04100 [Aurantiacibacter gangjinensis]
MLDILSQIYDIFMRGVGMVIGLSVFLLVMKLMIDTKMVPYKWFGRFVPRRLELPPEIASDPVGVIYVSNWSNLSIPHLKQGRYFAQRISIHKEGLSIRSRRPNYYFQKPILLPWDGLRVHASDTLLGGRWVALSHDDLREAYIVMPEQHIAFAIRHGAPLTLPSAQEMANPPHRRPSTHGPTAQGEREMGVL